MRVLELGKYYFPYAGGIETLLRIWCEGFVKRGAEVDCIVSNDRPESYMELIAGVRVHRCARYGSLLSLPVSPRYVAVASRVPCEIIHAHFPNPLADVAALMRGRGQPLVLSYHSDIIGQKIAGLLHRPLLNSLLRRADKIVVATPSHIDQSPFLPAYRAKCEVIPFGLDLSRFEGNTQLPRIDARPGGQSSAVILSVGRLVAYKGHSYLIEAMRGLDAVLWIVGSGPLRQELTALAEDAGVADRVVFWGSVDDERLTGLLHACDVFVLPSVTRAEAFGLVQVEAMAAAKPVVNTRLESGVPTVSLDGVTGFTVPPGDAIALRSALSKLLADSALRHRMGEAGRVRAFSEYNSETMISRYWSCFESLLEQRRFGR